MIEFLRRMFAPERSSETAKERLKLVLLSDHLSLAPDVVAALKRDLLEVISRYVEIDPANADVTFEQRDREVAMLASIPITGMRDRKTTISSPESIATVAAPAPAPTVAASIEPTPTAEMEIEPPAVAVDEPVPEPIAAPILRRDASSEAAASATTTGATPAVRRRKRRRKANASVPRSIPGPAHGTPGFDPA